MMDLKIKDNTLDLSAPVTEKRMVAQWLTTLLKTQMGDWFLDITFGVPYFESILVKGPQKLEIQSILKQKILEIPEVMAVKEVEVNIDRQERHASIRIIGIETTYGKSPLIEVTV